MIKILKKEQKLIFVIFVTLVFVVSFLTFWRAFSFDFWAEDWEQMWYAVLQPSLIFINNLGIYTHPISVYEGLFLAKFFGFNPFYWQIAGYLLRVLDVFAISLMMLGITRSRKIAFFTGLIFASFVGGLESVVWVSVHASALVTLFLCAGIFFWVTSERDGSIKKYLLSLILLLTASAGDPGRGIIGVLLVVLWEFLSFIQNLNREKFIKALKRIIVLVLVTFFLKSFLGQRSNLMSSTINANLHFIVASPFTVFNNFLNSLGNLLIGWFIPISQNVAAVSIPNILGIIAGYLFLFQTIFLIIQFLMRKKESLKMLLLFSIWIPVFFFPNWLVANNEMIGNGQVLGVTHRYLALSAIGLACWLGYLLSQIKNNYFKFSLLIAIVMSNILMANRILRNDGSYRSINITTPIWDKIENDVPKDIDGNSILTFLGEDKLRVSQISQAKIPFGIRRGIKSFDKLPYSTTDPSIIISLLCGRVSGKSKVPISHLYAWRLTGVSLENVSENVRRDFSTIDCSIQ